MRPPASQLGEPDELLKQLELGLGARILKPDELYEEDGGSPASERSAVLGSREGGVLVRLMPDVVEVAPWEAGWMSGPAGPPMPLMRPIARIPWAKLPPDREEALAVLRDLLSAARAVRHGSFRECASCERRLPPENMHRMDGRDICHGCAERHLGVVH